MRELAVIPIIWLVQTFISWLCAVITCRVLGLKKRPTNFVTAAAVFGNSNSLPISLVVSLSHTISGLHWSALPNDSNGAVAGRGILYLLLYQQLGQAIRWSWGVRLLKPKEEYGECEGDVAEEGGRRWWRRWRRERPGGGERYTDRVDERRRANDGGEGADSDSDAGSETASESEHAPKRGSHSDADHYSPAGHTPVAGSAHTSPTHSDDEADPHPWKPPTEDLITFPRTTGNPHARPEHFAGNFKAACLRRVDSARSSAARARKRLYDRLPKPLQRGVNAVRIAGRWVNQVVHKYMNPPLWAMVFAVVVASVPELQKLFFGAGFMKNSVTTAVHSMGGVAVPIILVVLGANLARNTEGVESHDAAEEAELGTKMLTASLVCRMVLAPLVMGPILVVFIKYVRISILDDPIFVVVNALLMGAPTALQMAQICQMNRTYEGIMAKILFQSYVIW